MFNLFSRKKKITDLSWLSTDMHSHLLPGIDDGSPDVPTSIHLLKGLKDLGIERFIVTPHVYEEVHPNTPESISGARIKMETAMAAEGLADIPLHASAEYMLGQGFLTLLEQGRLLDFPNQHLLVEMPYIAEPTHVEDMLFQIALKGYKPILAHPERYVFYFQKPEMYHKLKETGCLLQLNLLSPTGYYGKEVSKAAQYMIKHQMYDIAGTDLHHDRHLQKLTQYVRSGKAYEELGALPLQNGALF